MKTDEAEAYGCGGCFVVVTIAIMFVIFFALASCNHRVYDGYYGGLVERIDYLTVDGDKSMFVHTDSFILLTDRDRRLRVGDSIFIHETMPVNFYEPHEWVIVDGRKIPIR